MWRQGYDAVESLVGPSLEQFVKSAQFAQGVGILSQLRRAVEKQSDRRTRELLRRLNLPAGTDVTRLLTEIGDLKRQVRRLSEQLEAREQPATTPTRRSSRARAGT